MNSVFLKYLAFLILMTLVRGVPHTKRQSCFLLENRLWKTKEHPYHVLPNP